MTGANPPVLRVLFLTSGGIHGAAVLERLLAAPTMEIVGIVQSTRVVRAGQGQLSGVQQLVRRCGWRYAIYLWLSTWFADLALGVCAKRSVSAQARVRTIPVYRTARINDPESVNWLREHRSDLIVSAFFNQRVGETVIGLSTLGAVNIHPGPLPAFKGVDPVFFGMLRGSPEVGTTVHRMTHEFDSGPVLASETAPVPRDASVLLATLLRYRRGAELLLERLSDVSEAVPGSLQPDAGRYDSWPSSADVRLVRERGFKLVSQRDITAMLCGQFPGEAP